MCTWFQTANFVHLTIYVHFLLICSLILNFKAPNILMMAMLYKRDSLSNWHVVLCRILLTVNHTCLMFLYNYLSTFNKNQFKLVEKVLKKRDNSFKTFLNGTTGFLEMCFSSYKTSTNFEWSRISFLCYRMFQAKSKKWLDNGVFLMIRYWVIFYYKASKLVFTITVKWF